MWLSCLYDFLRRIQNKYKITYRGLIAAFVLLVSWLVLFSVWARWVTTVPLNEPISTEPPGKIEKLIRIPVKTKYSLCLVFERAGHPFEELKTLIGDFGKIPTGERVPIRWSMHPLKSGKPIASGEVDSFGANAFSKNEIERRVGILEMEPGQYVFRAEITRTLPKLAHIRTRVSLEPAHNAGGWQFGLVWFGSIINYLMLGPMAFITGLILLLDAVRSRTRGVWRSKGNGELLD